MFVRRSSCLSKLDFTSLICSLITRICRLLCSCKIKCSLRSFILARMNFACCFTAVKLGRKYSSFCFGPRYRLIGHLMCFDLLLSLMQMEALFVNHLLKWFASFELSSLFRLQTKLRWMLNLATIDLKTLRFKSQLPARYYLFGLELYFDSLLGWTKDYR